MPTFVLKTNPFTRTMKSVPPKLAADVQTLEIVRTTDMGLKWAFVIIR